jgi:hypothetical protein
MDGSCIYFYVVVGDGLDFIYCAGQRYECENHIDNAIDQGVEGAGSWVIRRAELEAALGW